MDQTYTIDVKCPSCGKVLTKPEGSITDDTVVTCKSCGHRVGTWAQLKAKVGAQLKDEARRVIRDIFKGR